MLGSGASGSDGATVERVWDLSKFLHVSTAGLYLCYIFGTENSNTLRPTKIYTKNSYEALAWCIGRGNVSCGLV